MTVTGGVVVNWVLKGGNGKCADTGPFPSPVYPPTACGNECKNACGLSHLSFCYTPCVCSISLTSAESTICPGAQVPAGIPPTATVTDTCAATPPGPLSPSNSPTINACTDTVWTYDYTCTSSNLVATQKTYTLKRITSTILSPTSGCPLTVSRDTCPDVDGVVTTTITTDPNALYDPNTCVFSIGYSAEQKCEGVLLGSLTGTKTCA